MWVDREQGETRHLNSVFQQRVLSRGQVTSEPGRNAIYTVYNISVLHKYIPTIGSILLPNTHGQNDLFPTFLGAPN